MSVDPSPNQSGALPKLGWLLQLPPELSRRYEAEYHARRCADMRSSIVVGLLVYNLYNATSVVLLPDILWLSIAARVLLMTPVALLFMATLGSMPALWRERLALLNLIGAAVLPVWLFWLSDAAYASFTVGEFTLTLVFANMLLCLRFPHAILFTLAHLSATLLAFQLKAGLAPGLAFAFSVQMISACLFTLYANYRTERQRCEAYLATVDARLRSEQAESTSRVFEDMSRTDALTGLLNRRALDDQLERWFHGARRRAAARLAVLMIDIDHFKPYNDSFGHPAGDRCLVEVARILRSISGDYGALCTRYGGEEFVVVLFDVESSDARHIAGELVAGVSALKMPHGARPDGHAHISISIGGALSGRGGGSHHAVSILAAADRALYRAKDRGRDRVEFDEVG